MDTKHLDELRRIEDTYWWHVAKRRLVTQLLAEHFPPPGRLIEGGVGAGANLLAFKELGYDVIGFDIAEEAVEYARSRSLENVTQWDLTKPWPIAPQSANVVVLLDVLEHLADPVTALKNAAATLAPGGGIIATVPAFPTLYCNWDRMLGHYRRYTRKTFRANAECAGLRVEWISSWNTISTPIAFATRGIGKLFRTGRQHEFPTVSPYVNSILLRYSTAERRAQQTLPIPFGLSLVGVFVPPFQVGNPQSEDNPASARQIAPSIR